MENDKREVVSLRSIVKCLLTTVSCSGCAYLDQCKEKAEKKVGKDKKIVISTSE